MYMKITYDRYLQLSIVPSPFLHNRRMRRRCCYHHVDIICNDGSVLDATYDSDTNTLRIHGSNVYRRFFLISI